MAENIIDEAMEDAESENLVLTDDNGVEVEFEYIDTIDYEGEEYVVLLPVEEDEDGTAEVLILKVTQLDSEDDEFDEVYDAVEDEALLDKLFQMFKEANADFFDFVE